MIARGQFRTPVGWPVVTGIHENGGANVTECVDVLELDEQSFRVWLVWVLWERGAIAATANDGDEPHGDPLPLFVRGVRK